MTLSHDTTSSPTSFTDPVNSLTGSTELSDEMTRAEELRSGRLESVGWWMNVIALPIVAGIGIGIAYQYRGAIGEFTQATRQRLENPLDLMMWMGGSEKSTKDLYQQIPQLIHRNNLQWQRDFDFRNEALQRQFQEATQRLQLDRFPVTTQFPQVKRPGR